MKNKTVPKKEVGLFEEFPSTTPEEWSRRVERDTKHTTPLTWKTDEGFDICPFYTLEDIDSLSYLTDPLPGEFPFARGNNTGRYRWDICQEISGKDVENSNRVAREALANGVNSLTFSGVSVNSADEMSELLRDIPLHETKLNFKSGTDFMKLFNLLIKESQKRNINLLELYGSSYYSPLNDLLSDGFLPFKSDDCFQKVRDLIICADREAPHYKTLAVNGESFSDAGANIVQELAFSLSAGCEYLVKLKDKGLDVDMISDKMVFIFSVGSSYFMEIAKLRAARILWAKIVEKFNPQNIFSCKMSLHCITSHRNKTLYDPYVNVLRGTVESMAAILGGCDSLCVFPFDGRYNTGKDHSARLARNTQLILKEEAYLHKVMDPVSGSYYIEKLTDLIASEALDLFQNVEKMGGFTDCVESSYIQDQVSQSGSSKIDSIRSGASRIVGTSQSPNLDEKIIDHLSNSGELLTCVSETTKNKVTNGWKVEQLRKLNLAKIYEDIRIRTEKFREKFGKSPRVFLLKAGDPATRSARAVFTANFFGCAGYKIIDSVGFDSIEAGANEAINSNAEIVVMCSDDEDYAKTASSAVKKIKSAKPKTIVVIAGYPKDVAEELEKLGVDDFIHSKSGLYSVLSKYHRKLGID